MLGELVVSLLGWVGVRLPPVASGSPVVAEPHFDTVESWCRGMSMRSRKDGSIGGEHDAFVWLLVRLSLD